jgi:flagellar L-ring protein precursor FlgH
VSNDAKSDSSASNTFSGTIGVTVVDVLENGNLVVSGEKQVSFDKGVEFIRFSGVVNPDMITTGNTVLSTQVADARVEYRTNSRIDAAELMSSMSRFFYSLVPL